MPTRESLLAERHRDGSLVFPPDSLLRAMLVSGTMPYGSIEALRRMHESNPTPAAPPLARAMLARYGITLDANGNAVFPPAPRLVPVRATIEEMAAHPMMLLYYTDPRRGKRQLAFAAYNATGAIDGQPPLVAGVCLTWLRWCRRGGIVGCVARDAPVQAVQAKRVSDRRAPATTPTTG